MFKQPSLKDRYASRPFSQGDGEEELDSEQLISKSLGKATYSAARVNSSHRRQISLSKSKTA